MLAIFSLLLAVFITLVHANPVLRASAAPVTSCNDAEGLVVNTSLPYQFTLAVVNITGQNDNSTGALLVLSPYGNASLQWALSTYASYPKDIFPTMSLRNLILEAHGDALLFDSFTVSMLGDPALFSSTTTPPNGVTPYYTAMTCPGNAYPLLAVHERADLWSLCPYYPYAGGLNYILVWDPSATANDPNRLFDPALCYDVAVNIVQSA